MAAGCWAPITSLPNMALPFLLWRYPAYAWQVHGCWTPMPQTLKDYISSPKPNGYRSLHTTVLVGMGIHEAGAQPLEVQ